MGLHCFSKSETFWHSCIWICWMCEHSFMRWIQLNTILVLCFYITALRGHRSCVSAAPSDKAARICCSLCGGAGCVGSVKIAAILFSFVCLLFSFLPPPSSSKPIWVAVSNRMRSLASAASVTHGTAVTSRDSSLHIQCGGNLGCFRHKSRQGVCVWAFYKRTHTPGPA